MLSAAAVAAAANTRKSRRLLEKDGRSTIDDIIEDVIRNGPSPKVAGGGVMQQQLQQPPPGVATSAVGDMRKSPRSTRKGKDRKISETSTDSSDEKPQQTVPPSVAGNAITMKVQGEPKALDDQQVAGTLSATTPVTPSIQVARPNETASVADKSKSEKSKPTDEAKAPAEIGNLAQPNSLTLIDPVTGEMA
uniref:Uncharacterized protein n=1 Tax=Anopheles coluzzii TaxID=1518534 RepID=A0A8W7PD31_ANOCL